MIEAEGNWMLSKISKHWYSSWHSPTAWGRAVDRDWKVLLSIQPLHWYHWDKKAVILDRFCSNACQPQVNNTNNCAGQSGCCVDHRALPSKVCCVLARKAKKKWNPSICVSSKHATVDVSTFASVPTSVLILSPPTLPPSIPRLWSQSFQSLAP